MHKFHPIEISFTKSCGRHSKSVDIRLLSAVGENIPAVVRGQTTILEHMIKDNMLDDLYKIGLGVDKYNGFLTKVVQQILHRYPHAKIFEIGKDWTIHSPCHTIFISS